MIESTCTGYGTRQLSFNCNFFLRTCLPNSLGLLSKIYLKLTPTGWLCRESFSPTSGV